jgi:hypothetical protein
VSEEGAVSNRLRRYVAHAASWKAPGATSDYERSVSATLDYAYLTGHYQGLLGELIDAFGGPEKVYAYLCAREDCLGAT